MNPFLQFLIAKTVSDSRRKQLNKPLLKKSDREQDIKNFKITARAEIINLFFIFLGIVSAGFGLKSFLLPNGFIDGGITGISLLVSNLTGMKLSVLLLVLNIPFILMGYNQIGKGFAIKTTVGILGLAICLATVNYPAMTADKLLVAVFGGFFLGAGIGLAVRGGGVLDGTEIMAIYLSKKTALTIGDIILLFNVIIFSFAAWLLSFETALYSILTYLAASKTIDFILDGIDEYTGVTIISVKSNEIRKMITELLGRGVTVYKGARGFGKTGHQLGEIDILFSVITRLEVTRLKTEIDRIDPQAFVVMNSIKDTKGGMIKKRNLR